MNRLTRAVTMFVAGVALIGGGVVAAAPAYAAPSGCASGAGCSWSEASYKGKTGEYNGGKLHFVANINDYQRFNNVIRSLNDKVSSVYNNGNSGLQTQFFKDAYYKGVVKRQLKGTGVANLNTIGFNDQASSACFERNCY